MLAGWAVLYALAGLLWWPSLPIAVIVLLTARARARRAVAVLADLIEPVTARCRKGA